MTPSQILVTLACATALIPDLASAQKQFDRCFDEAARRYGLDKLMLVAIARTESGLRAHVIGPMNRNGSYDIGMMQINSSWLPILGKYGISQRDLLNACTNIDVGAWVLAHNIARHGATWKAVGAYNAASQQKQEKYVAKVHQNYILMAGIAQ